MHFVTLVNKTEDNNSPNPRAANSNAWNYQKSFLLQKKLNNKVGSVVRHNSIRIKSSLRPITATDSQQHLKRQ